MRRIFGSILLCCVLAAIVAAPGCASGAGVGIASSTSSMAAMGTISPSTTVPATSTTQSSAPSSLGTSTTVLSTKTGDFESSIEPISSSLQAQMKASGSWKPGDPTSFSQLRLIHVSYWGFDNKPQTAVWSSMRSGPPSSARCFTNFTTPGFPFTA